MAQPFRGGQINSTWDITLLEKYAQSARLDFRQAVRERLTRVRAGAAGAAEKAECEAVLRRADPDEIVEQEAYGWFNRLAALRYLEVHGYLDYRVLSSRSGTHPEIMEHALELRFAEPF